MNHKKHTNVPLIKRHYGLALEEIKLERSINSLNSVLNSFNPGDLPEYLSNEKEYQERQLHSLRELRDDS